MNLSRSFIERPVGTILLAVAVLLCGLLARFMLPVSPMPQVDYPAINVEARMPGAGPETMAASVATPLERALGSIPGIIELTSRSGQDSTRIELRFDLDRNIDDAARDVQAAINAARGQLPSGMPNLPQYRKMNPSQAPVMALALTSDRFTPGELYDLAASIIAQKLAQIPGVGQINVGGGSLPAVRVSLNPDALSHQGVALDEVAQAIRAANALRPLGTVEDARRRWQVAANLQLDTAAEYRDLVVTWRDGRALRLGDIAEVEEGTENRYAAGFHNDRDAVLLVVSRQPQANIIDTVDAIHAQLPALRALLPGDVQMEIVTDRSPVIRATLREAQVTLLVACVLVVLVTLAFLGNFRAALVPAFAIPVSLCGALAIIWLCGFSLNTLSLMALIVATVLVVDDAIVVLENVSRHLERGMTPLAAAMRGAAEVGSTLLSMNLALAVVFLSILMLDDFVERLFREFSVTLVAAMLVSLMVSLSLTPALCARLLRGRTGDDAGTPASAAASNAGQRWASRRFNRMRQAYLNTLDVALRYLPAMLVGFGLVIALNIWLFGQVPKGVLPRQDTGQLRGFARGDDGMSFQVMQPKLVAFRQLLMQDPGIAEIGGFIGGNSGINNAFMLIQAKPLDERGMSSQQIIDGLRARMPPIAGGRLMLWVDQDMNIGGRGGGDGEYELRLLSDHLEPLREWTPRVQQALASLPELADVESSGDEGARQVVLHIDRDAVARLGIDVRTIATVLDNSFSQRQVAIRYDRLNQYRVVMELDPRLTQTPDTLDRVHVIAADGRRVPLSAFASYRQGISNDSVRHYNQFASTNIDFGLAPGVSLEQASAAIERAMADIMLPTGVQAQPGGEADMLEQLRSRQVWLVLGVVLAVYAVLGILYESFLLPLAIISAVPSAGVGALIALIWFGSELNLISLLGLFLLVGVIMKNTILMVDFALTAQRQQGLTPHDAVLEAARLRFRPILMTSFAALLGTLPLILATGEGWEMRRPLGLAIVGGLIVSQLLTLYTTPAIYLALARLRRTGTPPPTTQEGLPVWNAQPPEG